VLFAAAAGCASAQPQADTGEPAATPSAPQQTLGGDEAGPAALERFLANVDTLTADFEQRVYSASGNLTDRSTGTMAIERPGRFRWHFAPPEEALLWSDGKTLNDYEFDLNQGTISPLEEGAADPLALLSGKGDFKDVFAVVDSYTEEGLEWVELEPVDGGAAIESIVIGFGDEAPRRIEVVDATDQLIRIDLTDVVVNAELPAGLFEFEWPPGATVLGGD
jgi:outer membrane lipoprotein carrier protein